MSLQDAMGGQGMELSPVTLQVLGMVIPLVLISGVALHITYLIRAIQQPERWAQGCFHLRWRPVHWRMLLKLFIVFLVANLFMGIIVGILETAWGLDEMGLKRLTITLSGLGSYFVVWLSIDRLLHRDRLRWRDMFGCIEAPVARSVVGGLGFFLAAFPLTWLVSIIAILVLYSLGWPMEKQEIFYILQSSQPAWFYGVLLFVAVIGAPVIEELVFRGLLLPLLSKYMRLRWALLIVSALFAAIHLHLLSFFPLFLLALYLGLATIYFRSIVAPIIMHMAFNAVNLTLFLLVHTP